MSCLLHQRRLKKKHWERQLLDDGVHDCRIEDNKKSEIAKSCLNRTREVYFFLNSWKQARRKKSTNCTNGSQKKSHLCGEHGLPNVHASVGC